jgi:hypothetical protein
MIFVRRGLSIAIAIAIASAMASGVLAAPVADAQAAPAAPSANPFVDINQATSSPVRWERSPVAIQLSADGRVQLADLEWKVWGYGGVDSLALATGTEEKWQCQDPSNCPMTTGSGSYVGYPVNVMLEWAALTSHGYTFTTMVISSPTLGTSAQKLFY